MPKVGVVIRVERSRTLMMKRSSLDEKIFIQKIDDIFTWIHYCCIFLTKSCHVVFKVDATISHRIFFSHYF
jgi:hypothetical protein